MPEKRIGVIIQARMGSTRLPGKVMMKLDDDDTVLDVLIKRLKFSKLLDVIILATTPDKKNSVIIDLAKFHQMFPELSKSERISNFYCYNKIISSLGLCQFGLITGNFPAIEFVNLVTGLSLTIREFLTVGERILTLKHLFNLREGVNPLNHKLPERILEKSDKGPNEALSSEKEELIITNFLSSLNWDIKTTRPKKEQLHKLGLSEFIENYVY